MKDRNELVCPFCLEVALRHADGWDYLDTDSEGLFVTCRHCLQRVPMEEVFTPRGRPIEFRIASEQA